MMLAQDSINFDTFLEDFLDEHIRGQYQYISEVLDLPLVNGKWGLRLPVRKYQKYLFLLAQDFVNVCGDTIPELEEMEEFYKDCIDNIVLIHWNHNLRSIYGGPIKLVEFPHHSFQFVQDLRKADINWGSLTEKGAAKYLCLNGIPKWHRRQVYSYLKQKHPSGILAISTVANDYRFDEYAKYNWNNVQNFKRLFDTYREAPVNVITESLYTGASGILSEKTLMAFVSLQLPIFVAHAGAVEDARNYGFDVFDDVVDHSYDHYPNATRWKAAIDLNTKILEGNFDFVGLLPRLLKNQQYLLESYSGVLLDRFKDQVTTLLTGTL